MRLFLALRTAVAAVLLSRVVGAAAQAYPAERRRKT